MLALRMLENPTSAGTTTTETPHLLTQAEASRRLGASRWTLRKLVHRGHLRPVHLTDKLVRYRATEIALLAEKGALR